ncbi:hypothetical protein [Microbispora sp. H10836]|uniref:hypothetical protein n=1 Tax=Microbispora sp. H10836 TaxID=2729106 RepID=UPI001B8C1E79|nr:hypothetical protein [Microbispora sp. H10836]
MHGARLLGRLLWGLSFQRLPGTVVVIDRPHLDPNPFDAEQADPIVLAPTHLTTLKRQGARELLRRLAAREVLVNFPEGSAPAVVNPRIWRHNGTVRARGGVIAATG